MGERRSIRRFATRRKRNYNLRLIRRDFSYAIQELAELFNLHPNALRRWLKDGLRTIDGQRPKLIHGTDLIEFLGRRQRGRKRGCGLDEMYCFHCREPRRPSGGCVAIVQSKPNRLLVQGMCELCGTRMNRAASLKRLDEIERAFTVTKASPHLEGTSAPIDMCELMPGDAA